MPLLDDNWNKVRLKLIVDPKHNLACKYCGKQLINSNAHSGHLGRCSIRLNHLNTFWKNISQIIKDDELSLISWNSWDHSYLKIFDYESNSSNEAIKFLQSKMTAFNEFTEQRMHDNCVFYLIVITQVTGDSETRKNAFEFIEQLLNNEEINLIKKYWKQIGKRQYDPSSESFFKNWERFIRIKDELFFNVDFPSFVLIIDRFMLTYNTFGWKYHENEGVIYFKDSLMETIKKLMFLEQENSGVPSKYIHTSIPNDSIKYLHKSSVKRYSRDNNFYIRLENMPYDPRDENSAFHI